MHPTETTDADCLGEAILKKGGGQIPEPDGRKDGPHQMNRKHHDVFISYAQLDKPIADAICAKLESRRIRCWIAPRDVPPSKEFPAAIIDGIDQSEFLVLVFSSHANNSPHVIREVTNAVNKGRIILPVRVEDVLPSKSMEYLISVPHWLDAITPPLEKHIEELADTIENILASNRNIACQKCGTALSPHAKFCESCGASIPIKEPPPVSAPASSPLPSEKGPEPAPGQPPEAAISPNPAPSSPETTGAAAPPRKNTGLIIGAVIACIVVVAVLFFILTSPAGIPGIGDQKTPVPTNTATTPVDYRSEEAPINLVTLTVEPTQELPKNLPLYVEVSKDPTNAVITIQYNGGKGEVMQDNTVILSRSDGTVTTGKLNLRQKLSEIEMQGTRGTDRIQVIVVMGTGTPYTIIDKLLPFRARNVN